MPPPPPIPAPEAASRALRRSPTTYGSTTGRSLLPVPAPRISRPVGRFLPRFSAISRIGFEEEVDSVPLGLQILTMPNGAQMVQNPYVTAPAEAAPRLLSVEQQNGSALPSASETIVSQESNEEVRALPVMIRFINTGN